MISRYKNIIDFKHPIFFNEHYSLLVLWNTEKCCFDCINCTLLKKIENLIKELMGFKKRRDIFLAPF